MRLSPLSNSRHFHHPRKETSYPLAVTCHSPLPTALGHCSSTFSLSLSLCLFGTYHVNGIIKYSFVSSLFHLAYFHLCCSMYKIFIPCYGWTIFYCVCIPSFIYLFTCSWALLPHFDDLWIILLLTLVCRYMFEPLFTVPLGIYVIGEWLDHMIALCFAFWGTATLFSKVAASFFTISPSWMMVLTSVHPYQQLVLSVFLSFSHSGGHLVVSHVQLSSACSSKHLLIFYTLHLQLPYGPHMDANTHSANENH